MISGLNINSKKVAFKQKQELLEGIRMKETSNKGSVRVMKNTCS